MANESGIMVHLFLVLGSLLLSSELVCGQYYPYSPYNQYSQYSQYPYSPYTQTAYCSALGPPANGYLTSSCVPLPGSVCSFACNSGYTLSGSTSITCYNGSWSSSPPTCVSSTSSSGKYNPCSYYGTVCPKLVSPAYGYIDGVCGPDALPGSVCSFHCYPPFTPSSMPNLVCTSAGLWNTAPPNCSTTRVA